MYNIYKMDLMLYILIGFFTILIFSQLIQQFNKNAVLEGMKNRKKNKKVKTSKSNILQPKLPKTSNNIAILSEKNAGNIEYLKDRIGELDEMDSRINKMQQNVDSMQIQIDDLVQQQANYAQELAGDTPPTITGTEPMNISDFE
jgi:DNA repair ATPase RecN